MQKPNPTSTKARRAFLTLLLTPLALRADPAPAPATSASPAPAAKTSTKKSAPAKAKAETTAITPDKKTPQIAALPTIYVTAATRDLQPVNTTATSTTVITHDQLEDQKYSRVVDALATVPGLSVVTSGTPGQVTSVFTRGTNSDETLLTIDGRRQAPDFTNFYDFTNLTLDNVGQVEVVRTPSSALQGGNAIGGVINLTTLSGKGIKPEGSVAMEAGSFDTFREMGQSQGQIGGFDYGLAFSQQNSHFPRDNNDYENTVYRGNYGYQVAPNVYVDLQTSYTSSHTDDPGILTFPDPTANLFRETWNVSPRVVVNVTDFYTSTLYYNRTQLRQVSNDLFNFSQNRSQVNTNAVDWQNDFQIAHNWKITAGIQDNQTEFWDFDDLAQVNDLNKSLNNIGGYVQSQWEIIPGLNLLNSVRYDGYSNVPGAFSWRQGVSYVTPVTATVVHASVASAYAAPTASQLYGPGFFGSFVGNPDLSPATSLGWEAGAEQPLWDNRISLSATWFQNNIRDLIDSTPNFATFENIGRATTQGVELGVTARPLENLSLNVNYTCLSAVNDITDQRLLRRPRNTVNFTGTYKPIDPVTLSIGATWVMGCEDVDPALFTTVDAPDYFVLHASGTWQINKTVSLWVRGENLTNNHYQPVLGYPALGMAGYGGVKVSF